MNGIEFYEFLRNNYTQNGQPLYGNFTFCDWLFKSQIGIMHMNQKLQI
jgi:hypothetical protein